MTKLSRERAGEAEPDAPYLVAHRAGNDLERLRAAEALRIPLIEADVHLFAGRLEVRHLKTAGPLPILWDRWTLASPWAPRLMIEDLLRAADARTELMLDLKGPDLRLSRRLAQALDADAAGRAVTVCARDPRLLEPFAGRDGIRLVRSVGTARQLRLLLREQRPGGVSIHRRLLDRSITGALKRRAELLLSWPVETLVQARTLAGWGVDGLITENFEQLAPAFAHSPQLLETG